jgi:hypothetical protein
MEFLEARRGAYREAPREEELIVIQKLLYPYSHYIRTHLIDLENKCNNSSTIVKILIHFEIRQFGKSLPAKLARNPIREYNMIELVLN